MDPFPEFSPSELKYWRVVGNELVSYDLSQKSWLGRKICQFSMWMGWSNASFSKVIHYLSTHQQHLSSLSPPKCRLLWEKMAHYGNQRPGNRSLNEKIQQIVDELQRFREEDPDFKPSKKPVVPPKQLPPPQPPKQYKKIEGIHFPSEEEPIYFREERILPPPPVDGIQVGLPNVGNTCWLNSLLQLLASNTYLDPLFMHELHDDENLTVRNLFQAAFRALISDMRLGNKIDSERMDFFVNCLDRAMPQMLQGRHGWPQDVSECMTALFGAFEVDTLDSRLFANRTSIVAPTQEARATGGSFVVTSTFPVEKERLMTMNVLAGWQEEKGNIAIGKAFAAVNQIDYQPEGCSQALPYTKRDVFTHLPDQLLLYINRTIGDNEYNFDPIELNERGYVSLPLTGGDTTQFVDYNILSCTENTSAAHYVHVKREGDGYVVHDDGSIYSGNENSLLCGNIFYLERVKSS